MASGQPGEASRQINRLFRDGTNAALTDGQLLERFAARRPEAAESAFEALVGRHGPMVLRVCRGVLRDAHDVEDAFQATFLVLVKKAHAIGERELLAPWLYGVAHRVALKARGVAARRNQREGGTLDDPPGDAAEGPWLDLRPMLHEELNRLPEKYRKPVVLCHLQGLTHSEAAQELAWPVGTVSVRLARARKLLKERLTRRGLAVTASLWAAGLMAEGASAAVPEALIRSTARAAQSFATGKTLAAGVVSAAALTLTRSTLTMMFLSRLMWIAAPLLLGTATAGALFRPQVAPVAQVPPRATAEPPRATAPPEVDLPAGRKALDPVPPGFFDVSALATKDKSGPSVIQPGRTLAVEVLEALPGRPITGERLVRSDGTISLGFYGDLHVAGRNRKEIKVKLIEHLRKYLDDEVLGLMAEESDGKIKVIPPLDSNRVFVDDSNPSNLFSQRSQSNKQVGPSDVNAGQIIQVEVLQALPGKPITGQRVVRPDGTIGLGFYGEVQVAGLNRDQIKVKVIEHLRNQLSDEMLGLEVAEQTKGGQLVRKKVAPADSTFVFVDDSCSYIPPARVRQDPLNADQAKPAPDGLRERIEGLEGKLDQVLRELKDLRQPPPR